MPSRKGWLTPDTPISGDTLCRRVLIPDNLEFVGAVSGALLELTKSYNWEQFGTVTAEQAAAVMATMYADFVASDCDAAACPPSFRMWIGGRLQVTFDGGQTWTDAEQSGVLPPVPVRQEPTAVEKRCAAAANAAEVYHQVYLALLDQFDQTSELLIGLGFFSTVVGLLFGAWVGVSLTVINALLNFTGQAFAGAWAALEFLGDNDFTVELQDAFICLLFENSTVQNDVVTFNFQAVSDNISTLPTSLSMQAWLFWIMNTVGEQGLNQAGSTTSVTNYDCECGEWCHTFDFSLGSQGWTIPDTGSTGALGASGIVDTLNNAAGYRAASARINFDETHVTSIEMEYDLVRGTVTDVNGNPCGIVYRLGGGSETSNTVNGVTGTSQISSITPDQVIDTVRIHASCGNLPGSGNPGGSALIKRVTMRGTGGNPFGVDNCEE